MRIFQFKSGYRYTSDTLFLWDFAAEILAKRYKGGKILDVGAGCGILGLLLARDFKNFKISLLEIQSENFQILRKNVTENELDCEILINDFNEFLASQKFDFIVSNPPFYNAKNTKTTNEHKLISKFDLKLSLKDFIKSSSLNLKQNGELIFCYEAKVLSEIFETLKASKFSVLSLKFIHSKVGKESALALIHAKKNSKSGLKILSPGFMYDGENYSKNTSAIFKKANLESVDYEL